MTSHFLGTLSLPKALSVVGVVLLALGLAGCDRPPDSIKIGVAQPLSGNLAPLGQDLLNGVKLAVAEINKEGLRIKGKVVPVEIVALDDKADAAVGKTVAQQLVDAGVVAVIGHLNSGVSIAAAPIYAEKGIAQLAISTNPKFTQMGLDTTFRLVANDTLQAKAIGSFAANQLSATRFAVVDDGTTYGKGLGDGATEQLKLAKKEILIRQSFDNKTLVFDELVAKLKQSDVEVLVTTLNDFQMLPLIEGLKKVGYTKISILSGDTLKTTAMLKASDVLKGLYTASPILDAQEFSAGRVFLSKYQSAYQIAPAYGGHYTYDAMYVLAEAIRQANSANPKKITETLRKIDGYAPVTGSMRWDETGEQRYGAVGMYSARKGAWELQMRSDRW